MTTSDGVSPIARVLWVLLSAALASACDVPDDEFLCGVPMTSGSTTIRVCDGAGQVCVCASFSCARAVNASECPSGFAYEDSPFARDGLSGCVSEGDASSVIDQSGAPLACDTPEPAEGGTP